VRIFHGELTITQSGLDVKELFRTPELENA
jgi:hypothetical protein